MKIKNMKLLLIITILFTFSACEIIDEIDDNTSECYETANQIDPPVYVPFRLNCYVTWKDGTAAKDLSVKYQIHKEYCNGNIAGSYEVYVPSRLTDEVGSWDSYYIATYKFGNKKDRVMVKFIIAPGAYDWEYDFVLRWEDVEHELDNGTYYGSFNITLPMNADGS